MYYISEYRKKAIDKIIPYLIEFPQIVKIIEQSADRYQAIEDVIWQIADNFNLNEAGGIFLTAHAHNENVNIVYSDKADDAFTYGTDKPLKQAYGTGHYYSTVSYLSGSSKGVSDDKMRRAIKAKIIQNNTNGTIEDLIEALKLYFNIDKVKIFESYPLAVSISLEGKNTELNTSGNKNVIKDFLPACVALKYLYLNDKSYNIYQLGNETSYGSSRYPIDITENVLNYTPYYQSIDLNSEDNEYIKTKHNSLSENMYCCFTGELTKVHSGNYLLSSNNGTSSFTLNINSQSYFELLYNNTSYNTNVLAEIGKKYTFILFNSSNKLKLWIYNDVNITGEDRDKDDAYLINQIVNAEPTLTIDNYTTIENAPIYINGLQSGTDVISGDFNYYAIIFGYIDAQQSINDILEYYVTSYGQRSVLFNCISNTNHLHIHSDYIPSISTHKEITTLQSSFKYKKNHGNGQYAWFNGNTYVTYNMNQNQNKITNFDLNIGICSPLGINEGLILSNFTGLNNDESSIFVTSSNSIVVNVPVYNSSKVLQQQIILTTPDNILLNNNFNNIRILYNDNVLTIYNNNEIIASQNISSSNNPYGIKTNLNLGGNGTDYYTGLMKNLIYNVNSTEILNSPLTITLRDDINKIYYTNHGVRLITTPQLMNDINDLDLYGNKLIGIR